MINVDLSEVGFVGRILVADDNYLILRLLTEALKQRGHEVITASNGKLALECLDKDTSIQIMLLDLMMPVFDGRMVIEQIRANHKTKHLPIILITGNDYDPDLFPPEGSYQALVQKPFDVSKIITLIEQWIDGEEN